MLSNLVQAGKQALATDRPVLKNPRANANRGKNFNYQLASVVSSDSAAARVSAGRGRSKTVPPPLPQRQILAAPAVTPMPRVVAPATVETPAPVAPNPFHQPNGSIYTGGGSSNSVPVTVHTTPWAPYNGPRGDMDAVPAGGGKVTASGAPDIKPNVEPAKNQYNYTGPASRNPYFTTPGNPLRPGYVLGFENWFEENWVIGGNPTVSAPVNKINSATREGAAEALRLVQQIVPDAKITNSRWGEEGGPFAAIKPTWEIELPNGKRLNAGGVLNTYYNQGYGVTIASDQYLAHINT